MILKVVRDSSTKERERVASLLALYLIALVFCHFHETPSPELVLVHKMV